MLKIAEMRKIREKTQKEVADGLGLGRTTYNQYETGKREPDLKTLVLIANYFCVSVDYLLDNSPPSHSDLSGESLRLIRLYEAAATSPKIQKAVTDILEEYAEAVSMTVETTVKKRYEDKKE